MGKEVKLFKSEERKSRSEVSAFLAELSKKLGTGTVILQQGKEELTLAIPESLILEIQVEDEKKGKRGIQHSLEVEIKWFDNDKGGGSLKLG
jgi:amphi-Trp domain-containing protein